MIKETNFLDEKQRKILRKAYENINLYSLLCTRPINRNVIAPAEKIYVCQKLSVEQTPSFISFLLSLRPDGRSTCKRDQSIWHPI